jgi:hypothetical protein
LGSRKKEGREDKTLKGDLIKIFKPKRGGKLGTKDRERMEIDPLSWRKGQGIHHG